MFDGRFDDGYLTRWWLRTFDMIRAKNQRLAHSLHARLRVFDRQYIRLPGIADDRELDVFVGQLVESIRRVDYVARLRERDISVRRTDPRDEIFDPIRAAIVHERYGNIEEAFWLVFLFVHFGKHRKGGWRYAREVYGRLGARDIWDWSTISTDPDGFRDWLAENQGRLHRQGVPGGFGNHRKYESLDPYSPHGTGEAVASYVGWVAPPRTHATLIADTVHAARDDAGVAFHHLYRAMDAVSRFGRTARFEYLAMLGKLCLAPIEPASPYLSGSTGPLKGARRLFTGNPDYRITPMDLEAQLGELQPALEVGFQVLEDALCNWQKSPRVFRAFRG